ncbi:hypothetical protein PU560_15840 [Georgenia sp. 10Sc9-8]|uniref:DUF892 family protein n=1 Tax=Georgenia halotolerans TaxID=3028317 RepID=A0ABT5U202_9MICO|nr:hypothetical protein [Georgenia halotolerans]
MTLHARSTGPVLLEVRTGAWEQMRGRVTPWLATTALLQATFRRLSEHVASSVDEPHIRDYIDEVARTARAHDAVVAELYPAFGLGRARRPVRARGAVLLSAGRQVAAHLTGGFAGAHGPSWRLMRELMRSNLDAISGFAVTQQLGLALGNPLAVDLVFPVLQQKQKHQLLLQEYLLEMGANAVLYHRDA